MATVRKNILDVWEASFFTGSKAPYATLPQAKAAMEGAATEFSSEQNKGGKNGKADKG